MKKNKMMRMASMLLILVLLTTCTISGTFAKYVTSDSAEDSARVAKWGVTASVSGSLFSDSYGNNPTKYKANETGKEITVQAEASGTNVVAPGTRNDEGISVVLTGKPEVDTDIEFKFEVINGKEIKLAAGTYYDPTTGEETDTFTIGAEKEYYPVVFTLWCEDTALRSGNVEAIQEYLDENLNKTYEANTDLATIGGGTTGKYRLTWNWEFFTGMDAADTYLGNAVAGGGAAGASTDVEVVFTITATQVD